MTKRLTWKVKLMIVVGCTVLLLSTLFLFVPFRTSLVFYNQNTDEIKAYLPIQTGDTFQIIFKHSIHLTDVVEKYVVLEDRTIEQYEIVYEHFGIGMPSNANQGETFVQKDGKYHIKDLNNIFSEMKIRNGKTVSEHRLVWDDTTPETEKKVLFNDYFEPGAWYRVKIEKLSTWQFWKGVKISE